jgi:hypothetical protein
MCVQQKPGQVGSCGVSAGLVDIFTATDPGFLLSLFLLQAHSMGEK